MHFVVELCAVRALHASSLLFFFHREGEDGWGEKRRNDGTTTFFVFFSTLVSVFGCDEWKVKGRGGTCSSRTFSFCAMRFLMLDGGVGGCTKFSPLLKMPSWFSRSGDAGTESMFDDDYG